MHTGRKFHPSADPLSLKWEKHIKICYTSTNQAALVHNFSLNGGPAAQACVRPTFLDDGHHGWFVLKDEAPSGRREKSFSISDCVDT